MKIPIIQKRKTNSQFEFPVPGSLPESLRYYASSRLELDHSNLLFWRERILARWGRLIIRLRATLFRKILFFGTIFCI